MSTPKTPTIQVAHVKPNFWFPSQDGFARGFFDNKNIFCFTGNTHCREVFWRFRNQYGRQYAFGCRNDEVEAMAKFIWTWEKRLKLPSYTTIHRCVRGHGNNPVDCILVRPAAFWERTPIRRSFFTAMLRAARRFYGSNYIRPFMSQKILVQTEYAVKRFLSGYHYSTVNGQWHETFYNRPIHVAWQQSPWGTINSYESIRKKAADKILRLPPKQKTTKTNKTAK